MTAFLTALARRLGFLVLVIAGVTVVTFAISHLIPGDPARLIAGPRASPALIAHMRADLGLDRPVWEQYGTYISQLARGDLGTSILTGRPVAGELAARIPATLELMFAAFVLTLAIGIPLGVAAALYKDGPLDHLLRGVSAGTVSVPAFWFALILLLAFYGWLGWAPGSGRFGDGAPPLGITGFYLLDALLTGDVRAFATALSHLALPALTLAVVNVGAVVRIIRASMIEALGEDYIRTARAAGLSERKVVFGYALRNALIPFVTVLGMAVAEMLYGAVVVETVFGWPGTGAYVVNAVFNLDFPVIMGFTVVASAFYVTVNLLVDIAYTLIDPRMRSAL